MRQRHTRLIGLPTVVAENENVVDNLLKDESDKLQEDIIRVFRADQTSKYVPITKATTAREALKLALHFFEGNEKRHEDYTLSMVTVNLGDVVKVSRLPDQLCNLAERLPLSGRFYIKSLNESEQLLPDESVPILSQQANVSFLDLSAETVAKSVTTRDYKIFQTIPQTAYIEPMLESFSLELKSGEENKAILEFERLNNSEMFWVVWAILQEPKPERRAKVIKHFLQVARTLHALKNLNSLFNVIFGLAHISVKRLKRTWELVPKKWIQLFEEFEGLQDPSRNMSRYRSLLNDSKKNPPLIPFFPIVRKDFIFLHYGNDTKVEDLINFEKMRMVAKSVRDICRMVDPNGLHEDEYSRTVNEPNKLSTQSTEHSGFDVITEQFSTLGRKKHPKPAHITSEVSEAYGINQESNISVDTGVNANQMRKIYDDLLMSRRVKQYLKCLETDIITDEIKLSELSKELEPPLAPASELVSRRNKMNNVDSVSITSSQSMQSTEALLVKNGKSHSRQDSAPVSMSRGDIVKLDAGNNKQDLGKYKIGVNLKNGGILKKESFLKDSLKENLKKWRGSVVSLFDGGDLSDGAESFGNYEWEESVGEVIDKMENRKNESESFENDQAIEVSKRITRGGWNGFGKMKFKDSKLLKSPKITKICHFKDSNSDSSSKSTRTHRRVRSSGITYTPWSREPSPSRSLNSGSF